MAIIVCAFAENNVGDGVCYVPMQTQSAHIPLVSRGELVTVHFRPVGEENYLPREQQLVEILDDALFSAGDSCKSTLAIDIAQAGYADTEALQDFLTEYFNCKSLLPNGFTGDISLTTTADGAIVEIILKREIMPQPLLSAGEKTTLSTTPEQITSVEQGRQRALAQLQPGMSDLEKALILHDYLVLNCDYDYENYSNHTIPTRSYYEEGVYVYQRAVCNGYATAYAELMRRCGIDCYLLSSNEMNHAWNMIKIDGNWYHVDCTWDDPVGGTHVGGGYVTHTYFLRSDAEMKNCLRHFGWNCPATAAKSGAYVGHCFRPVADVNVETGEHSGPAVKYLNYRDGWYYSLVERGDYCNYYGGNWSEEAVVAKSKFDGSSRTFVKLGDDYDYCFLLDDSFYVGGCYWGGRKEYGQICRFSADFSEQEVVYISIKNIVNFSVKFGVLWMIEEGETEEKMIRPEDSLLRVEENGMMALVDPKTHQGTLMQCQVKDKKIAIPATLGGYSITDIGRNCIDEPYTVQEVLISQGIQHIGDDAFYGCYRMTSLTIPDSVTTIGNCAFGNCGMTEITLPDSVTDIGERAFYRCQNLMRITISKNVNSIGCSVLSGCDALTRITVAPGNSTYCSKGNCLIEKGSKTLIAGCRTSVIPADGSVTAIGEYAFSGSKKLTGITIPGAITTIGDNAFSECSLISVVISDGVTTIGANAFSNCDKLLAAEIPVSVNSVDWWAFGYCARLENIYYRGTKSQWEAIEWQDGAFPEDATIHYNSVKPLVVVANGYCGGEGNHKNLSWTLDENNLLTISGTGKMENYDWGSAPWSNYHRDDITTIKIEDNVTSIGNYAFLQLNNLKNVIIGSSVTDIGEYAFYDCPGLSKLTLPSGIKRIGAESFGYCDGLRAVEIPISVTTIENWAFSYCANLSDIYYRSTQQKWRLLDLGYGLFPNEAIIHYNTAKPVLVLASGICGVNGGKNLIWSLDENGYLTISGTGNMVNYTEAASPWDEYGDDIVKVTVGEGVTSLGDFAFADNVCVTEVTIPESVTSIGYCTFANNSSLTDVYYAGNKTQWMAISADDGNDALYSATIHRAKLSGLSGDLNDDYEVDIIDMACLYDYLSTGTTEGKVLDAANFQTVADVNGDSVINILDYQALYEMVKK